MAILICNKYDVKFSSLQIPLIHQKRALSSIGKKCLKSVISKEKLYLLGGKKQRAHERFEKAIINKGYIEYNQHQLDKKGEKTEKALSKHAISFYFSSISEVVNILD